MMKYMRSSLLLPFISPMKFLVVFPHLLIVSNIVSNVKSFMPKAVPSHCQHHMSLAAESYIPWKWKGHTISTQVSLPANVSPSQRQPQVSALLIHGFGCSSTYWRETSAALTGAGYTVHALDLLGQGRSAKPGRAEGIEYSIRLWAEQVDAYIAERMAGEDLVLGGNSLGSVIALTAYTGDFVRDGARRSDRGRLKGICMFNCGVGMNSRGLSRDPQLSAFQRVLIDGLLTLLDVLIFNNRILLKYVLDEVVTRELLANTLQSLYRFDPSRVDDELVESFYLPAQAAGSVEALSQIYTNDPGITPMELHQKYPDSLEGLPIQLVWGDEDTITPMAGGVGTFYQELAADDRSNVSFEIVKAGHVPFDDNPLASNTAMLKWLEDVIEKTEDLSFTSS